MLGQFDLPSTTSKKKKKLKQLVFRSMVDELESLITK